MSHTAVNSEVLFWFVVALTVLLGMLISVVVKMPPESVGSPQPPGPSPPAPPELGPVSWPQAAGLAGTPARLAHFGYRPRHAGSMRADLMVAGGRQVPAGPPWAPAPWPPGVSDRDTVPWLEVPGLVPWKASAYRELPPGPAHRRTPRHGAHRAGMSTGQGHSPYGGTGRHRAGVH